MFAARYFAPRYFAPRYWPEVGFGPVTIDYPDVSDVRAGVIFGGGTLIGTLVLPAPADVVAGVLYGAGGVEFLGEFTCPVLPDDDNSPGVATGEPITLDPLDGDDIDHDTLAAVEAKWMLSTLSQFFSHPPQSGRLKADKEKPQTLPYAHLSSELESREPWNAKVGVVSWMDRRKVTITVYGTREQCKDAIAAVLGVFNIQTRLTYPSGARPYRWRPQDGNTVKQDETTKAGQDVWQAVLTASVSSIREA